MKYKYQAIRIPYNSWSGKAEADYLDIINEKGAKGWRFVGFEPLIAKAEKGIRGTELEFGIPLEEEAK